MAQRENTPQVSHHEEEEAEQSYPNPFPALPVFNNPVFSKELEDSVKGEHSLPLSWLTNESVREPPAAKLGPVYGSRREAWKATGWVHCRDFLGQGGFGKVYLGFQYEDRHSNTPLISRKLCAIKEVPISHSSIQKMEPLVAAEAYILRAVSHPNIVRLFTCYSIPSCGRFYFVMEFADGKDLHAQIYSDGTKAGATPFPVEYGRAMFIGIVEGVAYLHHRGVGHRDIKPENILIRISADGQTKIPKIADFGMSTIYVGKENADGTREQFLVRGVCGTRSYMAPEIVLQMKNLTRHDLILMQNNPVVWRKPIPLCKMDSRYDMDDERNNGEHRRPMCEFSDEYMNGYYRPKQVDVYALGVTLYQMMTGDLPYYMKHEDTIVHLLRCEPMRCKWILPSQSFDFICQMLEPNPSKRLTIQQIREHEWMKGPVAGTERVSRSLPDAKYGVYVSPTASPEPSHEPSIARPADTADTHLRDQTNFNPMDIDISAWSRQMSLPSIRHSQLGSDLTFDASSGAMGTMIAAPQQPLQKSHRASRDDMHLQKQTSPNPLDISAWSRQMSLPSGMMQAPKKSSGSTFDAASGATGTMIAAPQQVPQKSHRTTRDETSGMHQTKFNPTDINISEWSRDMSLPSGMREAWIPPRVATGRGQAPQRMGALLNAFGNLALHPGADLKQRSQSLGAQAAQAAPLLRTRSSSLTAPGPSRVRLPSAGPADAPQKQESKSITSSLKDSTSRETSRFTGPKLASAPSSPRSGRGSSTSSSSSGSSSGGGGKKKKGKSRRSD